MIDRAAGELGFDPAQSFVVGDKPCDIDLGKAIGATTILVLTGYGKQSEDSVELAPDHIVDDLVGAADVIRSLLTVSQERPS